MNYSIYKDPNLIELRIHPNDQDEYGPKYTWCCNLLPVDEETVEIRMVMRSPTREEIDTIRKAAKDMGFSEFQMWRNGRKRKYKIKEKSE